MKIENAPLTEEDKNVIKKAIKPYYQADFILIPLLAVVFSLGYGIFSSS